MSVYENIYDNMSVISMATDPTVPDLNQIGNGTVQEYHDFAVLHNLTYPNLNLSEDAEEDDNDEVMSLIEDNNSEHYSMPGIEWDNESVLTVMIGGPVGSAIDVIVVEHNYTVIGGVVYIHD
jgi:hypothetical protein